MNENSQEIAFWEDSWSRHLEQYLSTSPRAGLWLKSRFSLMDWRVLEIAGGSCRDSRYLAEQGVDAIGSDFDQKTIDYLNNRFPESPLKLAHENAAAFSFPDKGMDLSIHNGFWIYFPDNTKIIALLREQARVTRHVLVALVHNAENPRIVSAFAHKAKIDPLYDIRFFHRAEIPALVKAADLVNHRVRLEKFGGPIDRLLSLPAGLGSVAKLVVPRLYRFLPWRYVERIALVIELRP